MMHLEAAPGSSRTESGSVKPAPSIAPVDRRAFEVSSLNLAELHCPYCDTPLEWRGGTVECPTSARFALSDYGLLGCGCSRYPVVAGIPIIQHREGLDRVIAHVESGDFAGALTEAFHVFRITWARQSWLSQRRYRRGCEQLIAASGISFRDAVEITRKPRIFSDYLFHRWANPSFLAAVPAMTLLDAAEATELAAAGRVLDLACGAGHSSFVLRQLFPNLPIVSTDHDFVSLYLAKRYLVPDGTVLCLDAEAPSPFPDSSFDGVFCLDAFHYFRSKAAVRNELRRIVQKSGTCVLAHLHNALQENVTPGVPLAPEHYLGLFDFLDARIVDEKQLLAAAVATDTIDLTRQPSEEQLRNAQVLTLVAGGQHLWKVRSTFAEPFARAASRLAINPIYRSRPADEGLSLSLQWPNDFMRNECMLAETVLPDAARISRRTLRQIADGVLEPDDTEANQLIRHFVVVPLPESYTSCGPGDSSELRSNDA